MALLIIQLWVCTKNQFIILNVTIGTDFEENKF